MGSITLGDKDQGGGSLNVKVPIRVREVRCRHTEQSNVIS